jgi:hypothetical protein
MNGHPPDTTARQRSAGPQQRPAAWLQDSECGAGIAGCKRGCVSDGRPKGGDGSTVPCAARQRARTPKLRHICKVQVELRLIADDAVLHNTSRAEGTPNLELSNLVAVTSAVQVRLTMAMMGLRIDLLEERPRVA